MKKFILFIPLLYLISCSTDLEVLVPGFGDNSIIDDTNPLAETAKQKMEGIYQVIDGVEHFGAQVVLKWSRDHLSIFGEKDAVYIILQGGSLESVLFFEGYWRYATNTQTGLAQFRISSDTGGDFIVSDGDSVRINLHGTFGSDNDFPARKVTLGFKTPLSSKVSEKNFWIVAHRGAGRTADLLPASENSLEMIDLAERFGANAIEIDVKLSNDRIPFLYHDQTINLRLTQKGPMWGDIEDFTFAQLKSFVTLINGEKIPSLREALEFVLEETNISLVWLDMKSEKNDFPEVIPIQQEIMERARNMGRDLEIFCGLPKEEKINQFLAYPAHAEVLSLNEFDIEDVRRTDSEFWGPRWTLGTQNDRVQAMQNENRRVITWTMDEPDFIKRYLREGFFDGMVTNYPTLVAYFYYTQ